MTTPERSSLTLLTGAGLASAIVCIAVPNILAHWFVPGAIFGGAIVTYLVLFERRRDPWKWVAFIGACSVALPVSMIGALGSGFLFRAFLGSASQSYDVPLFYLFVGGGIGSCIVLFSGMLLFGPPEMSRAAVGATCMLVALCGFLALVAGAADRQLGRANFSMAAVFIVWQSGVALMLGLLLRWTRESTP
jgi:hypothetical protein